MPQVSYKATLIEVGVDPKDDYFRPGPPDSRTEDFRHSITIKLNDGKSMVLQVAREVALMMAPALYVDEGVTITFAVLDQPPAPSPPQGGPFR